MRKNGILFLITIMMVLIFSFGIAVSASEVEEITVWIPGDEVEYSFYYNMFKQYEKTNENVKFKIEQQPWGDYWTKLPLELQSGRGPELFMAHTAYSDVLLPNAKELPFEVDELKENFKNPDLFLGENGRPVFIPLVFYGAVMYYNVDHWQEAGLDESDIPATWDELEKVAQKLTIRDGNKIVRAGFDYSTWYTLADLIYQQGYGLVDQNSETTIDSEAGVKVLKRIKSWEDDLKISDYTLGDGSPEDSFLRYQASIIYGHAWMDNWLSATDEELNFKAFPIPVWNQESPVITRADMELTFGINKNVNEKQYQILTDFTKFVLNNDQVMLDIANGFSGISSRKDLVDMGADNSTIEAIKAQMDKMIPMVLPGEYETVIKQVIEEVAVMDIPIAEALNNAVRKLSLSNLDSVHQYEEKYEYVDQLK
ncbi:ABC transporter substrate-binding protein [Halanaerobium praevalens]|uniref:Extracellular solute-binding protein family 1 n=1 Tax=Halanaerobium praevalens (strain ATCC 33744 / DSM 2228 / GSL) TaxID=572479 RepID=E3DNK0_HALPG|nr:extracellular solute-binding protein [Halanaerobium praevalens]ADO76538.1 extracellular solute-binding protein family 1 [Halanaerobium praevalens DSM 2228]